MAWLQAGALESAGKKERKKRGERAAAKKKKKTALSSDEEEEDEEEEEPKPTTRAVRSGREVCARGERQCWGGWGRRASAVVAAGQHKSLLLDKLKFCSVACSLARPVS